MCFEIQSYSKSVERKVLMNLAAQAFLIDVFVALRDSALFSFDGEEDLKSGGSRTGAGLGRKTGTLVIMTISSLGSCFIAFPRTISDCPFE